MEAVTTSMVVLLIIYGLGLAGASYTQCHDTLSSNGYSLTDSQVQSFYDAANDPDNIYYINTHSDSLANDWSSITSNNTDLSDWYNNYLVESSGNTSGSLSTVDSKWVEGGETQSVTVWDSDLRSDAFLQQYGYNGKTISDGHGGYYLGHFVALANGQYNYSLDHYAADGTITNYGQLTLPTIAQSGDVGYQSVYFDYFVSVLDDGKQQVILTSDAVYLAPNGSYVPKQATYEHTVTFSAIATSDVEDITDYSTTDLTINPDGSITLPDGTLVYPNADGTYTINGTDYVPATVIPDINDLLQQLLDLQQQIDDLKNELAFERDNDTALDVSEAVDSAVGSYEGNLSEFLLNSRITQVFPFCLPFDFVRGLKLFSSSPVAPSFDIDFNIPAFGVYPGTHNVISLDLGVYSKYFTIVRWVTTIIFVISLTLITSKLIKW